MLATHKLCSHEGSKASREQSQPADKNKGVGGTDCDRLLCTVLELHDFLLHPPTIDRRHETSSKRYMSPDSVLIRGAEVKTNGRAIRMEYSYRFTVARPTSEDHRNKKTR